jgi:pimeloyl-ACP methyl ester carboxylesterase
VAAERTEHPCLAVDLAGFGGSDLPARPAIEAYADDVVLALERLGVECCTVVGHSFGGAVAAAVAERSDAVRALILLAPAGFGRIALAETFSRRVVADLATLALPLALVNPVAVTLGYATFVAGGQLPDRELVGSLRSAAGRAAAHAARAAVAAIADAGRAAVAAGRRPARFAGPVAVLWGERDRVVPCAHADGVRAALPQAHVELWTGMGHHPQRERPGQLVHFVERHAHSPSVSPCRCHEHRLRNRAAPGIRASRPTAFGRPCPDCDDGLLGINHLDPGAVPAVALRPGHSGGCGKRPAGRATG